MSRRVLARLTLLFGIVSLGLAIVPGVALDEPMPWRRTAARESASSKVKEAAKARELKVKVKDVEFSLGKKQPPAATPTDPRPAEEAVAPPPRTDRVKPYRISAMILGLVGLALAPFAWHARSRTRSVTTMGVMLCALAIVWYQIVGAVAAAATVFVVLAIVAVIIVLLVSAFG